MTTVLEFKPNDKPGAKERVRDLHKVLSEVLAGGFVDSVKIDGVKKVLSHANTPHGYSQFHKTDAKLDKHTTHEKGKEPENYSYTLVPV